MTPYSSGDTIVPDFCRGNLDLAWTLSDLQDSNSGKTMPELIPRRASPSFLKVSDPEVDVFQDTGTYKIRVQDSNDKSLSHAITVRIEQDFEDAKLYDVNFESDDGNHN